MMVDGELLIGSGKLTWINMCVSLLCLQIQGIQRETAKVQQIIVILAKTQGNSQM